MKITKCINLLLAGGVLLGTLNCRNSDQSADTIKDTTLNQDTAYRTDTIIPRSRDSAVDRSGLDSNAAGTLKTDEPVDVPNND